MPHSAAATVRLAPIIKTNHAQALALDMHMIQQLHHNAEDEQQHQQQQSTDQPLKSHRSLHSGQTAHTAYSSPQLAQRTNLSPASPAMPRRTSHDTNSQTAQLSASPLAASRPLQTQLGQHNTLLYTFPHPQHISEESDTQLQQSTEQPQQASGSPIDAEASDALLSSPSAASLPPSTPLHVAVSSSVASDAFGSDTLLSPGPLHPSSSCSSLSPVHSPQAALSSPASPHSTHFALAATSPLLSPTTTATAAEADVDSHLADSDTTAARLVSSHAVDGSKSLTFADTYTRSDEGLDGSSAASVGGLPMSAPMLYPAASSPASSTSLAARLVVPVSGLAARKQCKISESAPAGHSLLRHCLPCLPTSSTSSSASSSSSAAASRSAAAYRRRSRQNRQSRLRRAGDDGCCSNLVTCNPFRLSFPLHSRTAVHTASGGQCRHCVVPGLLQQRVAHRHSVQPAA